MCGLSWNAGFVCYHELHTKVCITLHLTFLCMVSITMYVSVCFICFFNPCWLTGLNKKGPSMVICVVIDWLMVTTINGFGFCGMFG